MPSRNTYCLTWVSLTLDVGYLFVVAPAKQLLTLDEGYLLTTAPLDFELGGAHLGPPVPMQPLLLGCEEVANRFKGLDLIDRVPEELWMEIHDIVQEAVIKTIPKKKKGKMVL